MKYYVIINGESSLDIQGLAIESLPSISKPLMRSKREEIDGRNGDIITQLGYGAYDKTLKIGLWGDYDINEVITFFNQEGTITFSNEPDMYYNFTILNRIDFINQLEAFRKATITIHCQPFKYKEEETEELEIITKNVSGTDISIDDSIDGIMNIDLKGNTSQVQLSGKNLLKNVATTDTRDGITFKVNEDSSITISGTASAQVVFKLTPTPNETLSLKAGSYTLSTGLQLPNGVAIQLWYSSASTLISFAEGYENRSFNVASDTDYTNFRGQIVIASGKSFTTPITIYPMLRLSSTTSEYEQYCGGIPSPNPSYPQDIHNVSGNNDIVVCGTNLIDLTTTTNLGNNATINSTNKNEITITATATTYSRVGITKYLSAGTYTISHLYERLSGSDTNLKSNVIQVLKGGSIISQDSNTGTTFILSENSDVEIRFLLFTNSAGTNGTQVRFYNVMLNVGNQATTYEAYNSTTYPINLPVENLFDKDNANIINNYIEDSTGNILGSSNARCIYIPCKANTNYTISKIVTPRFTIGLTDTLPTTNVTCLSYLKDNSATSLTIQGNANAKYLVIYLTNSYDATTWQNILDSIQIEQGSKPNSYTPYGTTPIELNKIGTYQDYIYKENDKWYLHKEIGKVILDGSENWSLFFNTNGIFVYNPSIEAVLTTDTLNGLSDYYTCKTRAYIRNNLSDANNVFSIYAQELVIANKSISGTTAFKTWLSTHNVVVYYDLYTPTNTEITDTTLISQLNAIKSANSYYGTTNINQVNNDMPFILDVSYLSGTDNITITNHGNYYSKPKLTLTGTGNIGIYLNDSQIFQVALGTNEIIIIDTDTMEAYYESTLKNRQVIGDYNSFKLLSGENTIRISGTFRKLQVDNYSRWI